MCETARTAPEANSFLLFIERMVRIHRHGKTEHFPIFVGRPKATPAIRHSKHTDTAAGRCMAVRTDYCFSGNTETFPESPVGERVRNRKPIPKPTRTPGYFFP